MSSTRSSSPSEASFASFSSFSSGLYVPVHKRGRSASGSSFTSAASSWRSRSPACSERSMCQEQESAVSHQEPVVAEPSRIYSPEFLISLAQSPLSRIAPQTREALRAVVPQIVMNRRQRKYNEFFNGMGLKEGAGAAKKEADKGKAVEGKEGKVSTVAKENKDVSTKKTGSPAIVSSSKVDGNKTSNRRQNNGRRSNNNNGKALTNAKAPATHANTNKQLTTFAVPAAVKAPTSFAAAAKAPVGASAHLLAPVHGTSWRGRTIRGPSPNAALTVRVPIAAA